MRRHAKGWARAGALLAFCMAAVMAIVHVTYPIRGPWLWSAAFFLASAAAAEMAGRSALRRPWASVPLLWAASVPFGWLSLLWGGSVHTPPCIIFLALNLTALTLFLGGAIALLGALFGRPPGESAPPAA